MSAREDVHIKGAQSKGGSFFDMRFISAFQCLFVLVGAMIDWTFYDRPKLSNFRIGLGKLQKSAERMLVSNKWFARTYSRETSWMHKTSDFRKTNV